MRRSVITETVLGHQVCPSIHESLNVAHMAVLRSDVQRSPALSAGPAGRVDPGSGLSDIAHYTSYQPDTAHWTLES